MTVLYTEYEAICEYFMGEDMDRQTNRSIDQQR